MELDAFDPMLFLWSLSMLALIVVVTYYLVRWLRRKGRP